MRGAEDQQETFYSYVSQEERIPKNHPLRTLRSMVDPILASMSKDFNQMYADRGRPSIPPEYLLRALLVQVLLLMEQLDYNLLFRWFVGLKMDDEVWDHSTFSKNRDRLLEADIAVLLLDRVVALAREKGLLSDEHFTVDGTLIEAWASLKSFQPKGADAPGENSDDPGNPTVNFHGQQRKNDTHQSTTDPESKLYRKGDGKEAKLSFMGHALIDNRHGLVVSTEYTQATGKAEREAGLKMIKTVAKKATGPVTLGADKSYDTKDFIEGARQLNVVPHVAQNTKNRTSAIDHRTTRHPGYAVSQRKRKLIEEAFGWIKTIGLMRKTRHKGLERGGWMFTFANALYDLVRIRTLTGGVT
jgi:transposase